MTTTIIPIDFNIRERPLLRKAAISKFASEFAEGSDYKRQRRNSESGASEDFGIA